MCGICCCVSRQPDTDDFTSKLLHHRGPDGFKQTKSCINSRLHLHFIGYTLHFQGDLTLQPVENDRGDFLLWNGEIFYGLELRGRNDGYMLLSALTQCENNLELLQVFSKIHGPWAFIFYQASSNSLWFGRDALGRRSLLCQWDTMSSCFTLASVPINNKIEVPWFEIPAAGIYQINLNTYPAIDPITCFSWTYPDGAPFYKIPISSELFGGLVIQTAPVGLDTCFNRLSGDGQSIEDMADKLLSMSQHIDASGHCDTRIADNSRIVDCVTEAECKSQRNETENINDSSGLFLECTSQLTATVEKGMTPNQGLRDTYSPGTEDSTSDIQTPVTSNKKRTIQIDASPGESVSIETTLKSRNTLRSDFPTSLSILRAGLSTTEYQSAVTDFITVLREAVNVRCNRQSNLCGSCLLKKFKSKKETELCSNIAGSMTSINKDHGVLKRETSQSVGDVEGIDVVTESADLNTAVDAAPQTDGEDYDSVSNYQHLNGNCTFMQAANMNTAEGSLQMVEQHCRHCRVAVLFSGGIDSLILAVLASHCLPDDEPIDLLNVAFEQQIKSGNSRKKYREDTHGSSYSSPDRRTGLQALERLRLICPNRRWSFIQVDVSLQELATVRNQHIGRLIYPLNSVLDDSIGCALWFATRGRGVLNSQPYDSTARVVLSGLGADELLGGYSRHRVCYQRDGVTGLINELRMELERISSRNLGRDDRIISDHSKEGRFPYLDEQVIKYLNDLPLSMKVLLSLPRGLGEKFLLRLVAYQLGLQELATLPKRAMQFGSRIAKCEDRREKGSEKCSRLNSICTAHD